MHRVFCGVLVKLLLHMMTSQYSSNLISHTSLYVSLSVYVYVCVCVYQRDILQCHNLFCALLPNVFLSGKWHSHLLICAFMMFYSCAYQHILHEGRKVFKDKSSIHCIVIAYQKMKVVQAYISVVKCIITTYYICMYIISQTH